MAIHTFTGDPHEWNKNRSERDESKVTWDVTYEGCVLQIFERNGYDDSDFYAIVWDETDQCTKDVCYATTRGWTYANGAEVDATPEVLAAAQAWMRSLWLRDARAENVARSLRPAIGKEVRILPTATGRNRRTKAYGEIPAGTTGYVCAVKTDEYSRRNTWASPRFRVGLQYGNTIIYLPWDAVEVVDPDQYLADDDYVESQVPAPERITNFHRPMPGFINMVAA